MQLKMLPKKMSAILSKPECVFNVSDLYLMESKDGIYGSIHQVFGTCNCDIHVFKQCSIQKDPNALLSFPGYNLSKYHIEIGNGKYSIWLWRWYPQLITMYECYGININIAACSTIYSD